ncbi:MAG: hypothetical protein PHP11_01395 [Erysipelotrichaceae bacterium]|nr:hypothetical protein [Erysipelotrichaceae bacterium]MDD3923741.1 hypothetical protein [Erysipelotrichaceae bacterium]MDD4642915.1 hypothetical protein [Erysipelotrichaceae bacterium]
MEIIYSMIIISFVIVIFLMFLYIKNRYWENIVILKQNEFNVNKKLKRTSTKYQHAITLVSLSCFVFVFSGINLGLIDLAKPDNAAMEDARLFASEMQEETDDDLISYGNLKEEWKQAQTDDNYYLDNYDIGDQIEFDEDYLYKETIIINLHDQDIYADIYVHEKEIFIYFPSNNESYRLNLKK